MLRERAYGKLNLTLDILRRREDGYHDLRMVMQSVELFDEISIDFNKGEGVSLHTSAGFIPRDENNTAVKAAELFRGETGAVPGGITIHMDKRLPVCAGMAGGSSDGAAVLRALRRRFAPELPAQRLEEMALRIGSDAPYCLRGNTALAEGRGERLTDLPALPDCWILVCKPDCPISTPELFGLVRARRLRLHPDTAGMVAALETGDLEGVCHRVYNVFEDCLPRKYRRVAEIKRKLLSMDAMCAAMTGTGPTVFAIFREREKGEAARAVLAGEYRQTYLVRPLRQGNLLMV